MIRAFRYCPGDHRGGWVDAADLPESAPDGADPAAEIWWVDLRAPTEAEEARVFNKFLPVHPLTLEDAARPRTNGRPHLPKVEEFRDYLFVVSNTLAPEKVRACNRGDDDFPTAALVQQLSAVLTHNVLITHHDGDLAAVESLHEHLIKHPDHAERGPDYLFHLVLDAAVDEYAPLLDEMAEDIDEIEDSVFRKPDPALLTRILRLKRTMTSLRRTLSLQREVLAQLQRGDFRLIDEREVVYYRNVYDHLLRYTELLDAHRDTLADLSQTHLAAASNRLNEVMKVLTMISTIVLPMTLVAGVYGMNFEHMPELKWDYGYPMALAMMVVAGVVPVVYFRRRGWL